jgi:hypothetical protein
MTNEQARILADNKRAEIIRNALIEKSPQGLGAGLLKFGAGLAAMATDPLEVATTFIPVAGPALKARAVSRLGQVGGRVAIGATEGAVGQALVEPIYYGLSKQQQLDYTMADALTNVGFGLLFGGGVGAVAGVLGRRAQRARLDPKLEKDAAEISFRQFATDQSVDVTRFFDGRDVRSQAPIFRSSGVEFQEPVQDRVGYISRPSYLAGDDSGTPLAFDSQQKANDFANKNGGTVVHIRDGFAVRITSDGDFIRTPSGKPVEFSELGRADDFVNSSRLTGVESEGIDLSAAILDSLEQAQKDDSRFVKPLVEFIRRSPEVDGATLQVHPEGRAADELRSKGITPRSAPGLFSRRGRKDFDNLVANEFEKEFPGIIEATGTSRSEFYLDPDGFIDLIKRDVEGDSNWLNSREKVSAIIRDAENLLYNVDLEPKSGYLADFKRKDRLFIDPDEYEFVHGNLSNIEIEKDLRGYIERNQIEFLSDEDFKIALEELQEKGGDVEAIVDSFAPARDDFVKEKTSAPTGSKVVKIGENRYLIAHNMSDADIRSIERNPDLVEIPRGIDTRKESILSSPSDPISEALTGPAAQKQVASELAARSADVASDPYADVGAAQRAAEISRGNADLQASAREDIDYLQRIVDQIENDITVGKNKIAATYTTAKGSKYKLFGDGTTQRDKAARQDAGHEGDFGEKKRSSKTVYVEENAAVLSAAGLQGLGAKGARVIIKNGKASLLTFNDVSGKWGRSPSGTDVPVFDEPREGLYPLELWKPATDIPQGYEGYRGMHAGNKITEITFSKDVSSGISEESRVLLDELNQIDEKARAYREVAEAAAVCLTRS